MPIEPANLVAAPPANATPPADAGGPGENGQSFQATLANEIRNQGSDAKGEPAAAKKPEDSTAADPSQPADPAQADLLISGLIKPQLVPSAEAASPQSDSPGLAASAATSAGTSPIDCVNAAKAQALLADQMQAKNPPATDVETTVDDATKPAVENGARSRKTLNLNHDAAAGEDPAKPRANGFRQGLDHALQQVAANKADNPSPANTSLGGIAAAQSTPGSPAARPSSEAMNFAKAVAQTDGKRAANADTAAALPGKEPAKPLDGLKHDSISALVGEIHTALNAQTAATQLQANPSASGLRVDARMGTEAWSSALGQQVILMAAGQQQQAEIHLNPESLGPIKVTITLDNNQASLSFVAREVSVRDAIEASLPKLTSMMSESGISLGQTNVSADHSGNPTPWSVPENSGNGRQNGDAVESATAVAAAAPRILVQQGLIDTFA